MRRHGDRGSWRDSSEVKGREGGEGCLILGVFLLSLQHCVIVSFAMC